MTTRLTATTSHTAATMPSSRQRFTATLATGRNDGAHPGCELVYLRPMTTVQERVQPALTHPVLCRHPVDRMGRMLMRLSSRRVARSEYSWLVGPSAGRDRVGHDWVARTVADLNGSTSSGPDHGLINFADLAGPGFDPSTVDPRIADFYNHASRWQLDLWSQWSAIAWPAGKLLTVALADRLQQACMPMRPLDVSHGMTSEIVHIHDSSGAVTGSAWMRTMVKTGKVIVSGLYGVTTLPGRVQPSLRGLFPLPLGSLQVFLSPRNGANGSFHMHSGKGSFGEDGAYLVLERPGDTISVRRIPLNEDFHLYVDPRGHVRADHCLKMWNIPTVRLHYRITKTPQR
jgi:hypothetical protein